MGWTFYVDEISRKEVIEKLTTIEDNEVNTFETLKHCTRGNVLWTVVRLTNKKEGTESLFIGCILLQRAREKRYGRSYTTWGYKQMCESMHPAYYTCPLSYLELVPVENQEWRDRVKTYHRKYKIGEKLLLEHCKIPYLKVISCRPLIGVYNDTRYRVPRNLVSAVQ